MATRDVVMRGHGERLRELRVKRGLSLRTLAARTGLSPTLISQLEADAVSPPLAALEVISHEHVAHCSVYLRQRYPPPSRS
jgi:transcriptional regulator with XRE-family HTH domain